MNKEVIFQIVPSIPPILNGVGDYAFLLGEKLGEKENIKVSYIVINNEKPDNTGNNITYIQPKNINSVEILNLLKKSKKIILHYVGYGYDKRGCPDWIVSLLEKLNNDIPDLTLVTVFHELYARSNYPWKSSFWLSRKQKQLVKRLLEITDISILTNNFYKVFLEKLTNKKKIIEVMPVFSTVGELYSPLLIEERENKLVIFGSKNSKRYIYENYNELININTEFLKVKSIADIGTKTGMDLKNIINIPVEEMGVLPAETISKILSNSKYGIVNFSSPKYLAKSTIFAAYCSHSMVPVIISQDKQQYDNIQFMKNYISFDIDLKNISLQLIADNSFNWYKFHNLEMQAKKFNLYLNHVNLNTYYCD